MEKIKKTDYQTAFISALFFSFLGFLGTNYFSLPIDIKPYAREIILIMFLFGFIII